jgi:hypothetical protein
VNNYVSIDDLYNQARTPNMQPGVPDTDLAVLFKSSASSDWGVNYGHTPILDVYYGDGFVQGQGYMDAWVSSSLPIAGDDRIRQTFTVSQFDRSVTHVSVRLRRVGTPGALTIRLEHGDGTLVEEATLTGIGDSYAWVTAELQQARLLEQGRTYHVVLSAPPGDHYQAFVLQQGTGYGFQTPTMFIDGHAQYSSGSGWQDVRDRTDSDFQLYFTMLVP